MELNNEQIELIAERIHIKWSAGRRNKGWKYGKERNDYKKETPCLVPYHELPEVEKEYDRSTALETLSVLEDLDFTMTERRWYRSSKSIKKAELELIAKRIHQRWSHKRITEGWSYAPKRDDKQKTTPNLVEYDQLPDSEKQLDRNTAKATITGLRKAGYCMTRQKHRANGFILLDRFLILSIWKQIGVLFLILAAVLMSFLFLGFIFHIDYSSITFNELKNLESLVSKSSAKTPSAGFWEQVNYIFSRLIDPGNINDSQSALFASIITITGWVLCSGFLIAIITNGYFERIKKVEKGLARYNLKDHCIIIGTDKIHLNIIRNIRAGKHKGQGIDSNCPIILFSAADSEDIRSSMKAFLKKEEEKNVFVYRGDRTSGDHLRSLFLENSCAIFVLGEHNEYGGDSMNIACVSEISTILNGFDINKRKPCSILLDDPKNFHLLMENDLHQLISQSIKLSQFNNHDSWSSMLFMNATNITTLMKERIASNWENRKSKPLRFVIIGFNKMGHSLLNQAIRTLQFGMEQQVIITVVDKYLHKESMDEKYIDKLPGWELLDLTNIKVEFDSCDIESSEFRKEICQWVSNNDCQLMGIAICFQDPTMSLYDGLNLPSAVYQSSVPVMIYQEELHGLAQSISLCNKSREKNHKPNGSPAHNKHKNVRFFGMMDHSLYFFDEREEIAENIQKNYQLLCDILQRQNAPFDKEWNQLTEQDKWPNRFKAESAFMMDSLLELKKNEGCLYNKSINEVKQLLEAFLYIKILDEGKYMEGIPNNLQIPDDVLAGIRKSINQLLTRSDIEKYQQILKGVDQDELNRLMEYIAQTEHNRWMAERILGGWNFSEKRDNTRKLHNNLCQYKQLDEITKMYDRGCII